MESHVNYQSYTEIFRLPGGYISSDGKCHNEVELKPLTGKEEELIADKQNHHNLANLLSLVLTNCITRIGKISKIDHDVVRNLILADRDFLLLCLRKMTFGNKVQARLRCPNTECGELMDLSFDIDSLEVKEKNIGNGIFKSNLSDLAAFTDERKNIHKEFEFRLPTAGDQEEIAEMYEENESKALTRLFSKCLTRLGKITKIDDELVSSLTILARREIESKIKESSPIVNLDIHVSCPKCNTEFESPFDIQNFFLKN